MEPVNLAQLQEFLDYKFQVVFREINELKETQNKTLGQTTLTNGSVRELKEWRAKVEGRDGALAEVKQTSQWRSAMVASLVSTVGTIIAIKVLHLY